MKRSILVLATASLLAAAPSPSSAQSNPSSQTLTVQGVLRDKVGNLQSSDVGLVVRVYPSLDAAAQPFHTQHFDAVKVENGYFAVELSGQTLSFSVSDAWIGIQVAGDSTEMPRQHLTAVPYAFNAAHATQADQAAHATQADGLSGVLPVANGGTGASAIEPDYNVPTDASDPNGLKNGITNYGAKYAVAGYFKDPFGIVHLKGLLKTGGGGGTVPAGTTIFTLKPGYRPAEDRDLGVLSYTGSAYTPCELVVRMTGEVGIWGCGNSWVSIENIHFRAAP
jgi:hypothetical protein